VTKSVLFAFPVTTFSLFVTRSGFFWLFCD